MLCPVFHCNFLMHNFAKWPKKQRKNRHELNETHNSMSVLFMVCASNNFQINHQLSFEYEKKTIFIRRHSSPFENTLRNLLVQRKRQLGSRFFFLFSVFLLRLFVFVVIRFVSRFCPHKRRSVSSLSFPFLLRRCCRWYVQYGEGIHIFICISMYRFITHRKSTVAMSALLPMIHCRTNNCTLIANVFATTNDFFQFFFTSFVKYGFKKLLSSKNQSKFMENFSMN